MRKKKHFYTVVCLIAGVILLTTAAAANYGNASGYPLYKSAIKKILYADNYTASLKIELIYDGETTQSSEEFYMLDADSDVLEYSTSKHSPNLAHQGSGDRISETWVVTNTRVAEGEPKYLSISKNGDQWSIYPTYGDPWTNPAENELMGKTIRFVELLADTFIGDIKNNIVQTSDNDGLVSYQVVLSGNQLPEYVSAGLSMLFSASREGSGSYVFYDSEFDFSKDANGEIGQEAWDLIVEKGNTGVVYIAEDGSMHYFESKDQYYDSALYEPDMGDIDDILNAMDTEPVPESAKCFITLDEEGRLVSNVIEGIVSTYDRSGAKHTIGLRVTANLENYGTTQIEYPEIPEGDIVNDYSKPTKPGQSASVYRDGIVSTTEIIDEPEINDSDSADE